MPWAEDIRLIESDPKLPGLRVLLDNEAMRGLFSRHAAMEQVTSRYIRYKPGVNALVAYDVVSNGQAVQVYAKTAAGDALDKLRPSDRRPPLDGPLGPGFGHDKSVPCGWWTFPNDSRIHALRDLASSESTQSLLRERFELEDASLEAISYKPERRFVGRVIHDGKIRGLLKLYTRTGYTDAVRSAKYYQSGDRLRVASLIASARRGILGFSWLDGMDLRQALEQQSVTPDQLANIGSALSELHRQKPRGLLRRTHEQRAAKLQETAETIGRLLPDQARSANEIAAKLIQAIAESPEAFTPIHGDFYSRQILLQPKGTVGIIDLDEARRGSPAEDLGNFIAHLERDAIEGRLPANTVDDIAQPLLAGYISATGRNLSPRVDLYTAVSLFQLVHSPFRTRTPDWSQGMSALLDRAAALADQALTSQHRMQLSFTGAPPGRTPPPAESCISDKKIPYLDRALNPSVMEPLLRRVQPCLTESSTPLEVQSTRLIRHKRGRRCVIEYTLTIDGERTVILGKIKAKNLQRTGYCIQDSLWLSGFGPHSPDGLCVPQPVGMVPEFNMILQRKVAPSTPIEFLLEDETGQHVAERIADSLYKMHRTSVPPAQHRLRTIEDEVEQLLGWFRDCAVDVPALAPRLARLRDAIIRESGRIDSPTPSFIHRDFYHDQVVAQGDRIYVLDFDLSCYGDPAIDVGNFLAHLTERSLREYGAPAAFANRETVLRDRYLVHAGANLGPRIDLYRKLTLARLVWISRVLKKRNTWTEPLLDLCEQEFDIGTPSTPNRSADHAHAPLSSS